MKKKLLFFFFSLFVFMIAPCTIQTKASGTLSLGNKWYITQDCALPDAIATQCIVPNTLGNCAYHDCTITNN